MKIAINLLRSLEGCGVTRYALEEQKWYTNHGIQCDIYAGDDKKWGRRNSQENNVIEFSVNEIPKLKNKLNDEYDIVFYQSLPSKSGHSERYQNDCFEHLICGVTRPIKISHQNDHKLQSLSRNAFIWETMAEMDASFTHSLSSPFAKKMKELNPSVPLIKMGLGFDFDELLPYWKPIKEQVKRISYFGRFAGFKDPGRITEMQPFLEKYGIIGEMKGIERSIGSLDLFYDDVKDRKNTYKKNIFEVKKEAVVQTPDKVWIYGPYNRLEGIEDLSKSMFGADFYHLDAEAYGDNMEFAMCEIISCGVIPVFDKHWADNCKHLNGNLFRDIKNFAIYSDKNDLETTVMQMQELASDNEMREKRRKDCFELAKEHCDNEIVYKKMHEDACKVIKRTLVKEEKRIDSTFKESVKPKAKSLF